jgi:hypothetical protein
VNWIDTLRDEHGEGPALWDAIARKLHEAHTKTKGVEPDFDGLPVEAQERWLDRAVRLAA